MKCIRCGLELPEDSVFCQYCGSSLSTYDETNVGLDENHPVPAGGLDAEKEYISKLCCQDGTEIKWDRKGSVFVESLGVMVDVYEGQDITGKRFGPVYINMYAATTMTTPIKGYSLSDKIESTYDPSTRIFVNAFTKAAQETLDKQQKKNYVTKKRKEKQRKTKKTIFCKKCGGMIDAETKKCQGCGKQYFSIKRLSFSKVALFIAALLLCCNCVQGFFLFQQNKTIDDYTSTINVLKQDIEKYKSTVAIKEQEIAAKNKNIDRLQEKANFFTRNAVIVPDDGYNRFHKYGCEDCDLSNGFWIYNIDAAESEGYSPCKKCCPLLPGTYSLSDFGIGITP